MIDNRFNKILTTIIVITLIGLFIVMGFWGYDIFQKYYIRNGAEDAVNEFDQRLNEIDNQNTIDKISNEINQTTTSENSGSNSNNSIGKISSIGTKKNIQMKYRGFDVVRKN